MTNTLNTPVEALELEFPMRVRALRAAPTAPAAPGAHRGGDGIVRAIRVLEPATLSLLTDRRAHAPQGAAGGAEGATGENRVDGEPVPAKGAVARADSVVTVVTPGGGGWGVSGA